MNDILQSKVRVAVIGLGYVGLPLALLAEEKGFDVIGVDLDHDKLTNLKKDISGLEENKINDQLKKSKILFTANFEKIKDRDIVIICVPTPVDENKNPDLSFVKNSSLSAAKTMLPGKLLVIESTINPGVCDDVLVPMIEKETIHVVGKTLYLAHCPERINPGDPKWSVENINRVLAADSKKGLDMAYGFYSNLIDAQVKKMDNLKEAEAVKIVENTFRDVNIAFVNELAMSFSNLGININNVIDGAATKPFAFMAHYPGIGVGGHCIPVDPYYLIEYARGNGFEHQFLSLARTINESMPVYSVDLLEKALIEKTKKSLDGSRIAVLGLSYKGNVGDDRESPAYTVIDALIKRGAKVTRYDPFLPKKSDVNSLNDALNGQDAVVIAAAHDEFKDIKTEVFSTNKICAVLDGRNIYYAQKDEFFRHGIAYVGIGS